MDATDEEIKMCESIGVKAIKSDLDKESYGQVNHKRLKPARDFIESSSYKYFLITDVFDVVFQQDPFEKLDFDSYDIFACTGFLSNHESPLRHDRFVTQKIINGIHEIKNGNLKKLKLGNIDIPTYIFFYTSRGFRKGRRKFF